MLRDAPYVLLFVILALLLFLLHFQAEAAELRPSFASEVEAGTATNGAESPIGISDFSLRESHTLEVSGAASDTQLRGSLNFEQTSFTREDFENDQSIGAELDVGRQVSANWVLRGSFGVKLTSLGDDYSIAGLYVATRTLRRQTNAGIEAIYAAGGNSWHFGLAYSSLVYGAARFVGVPLPDTKLQADVHSLTGSLAWRGAFDAGNAVVAGVEAQTVLVPEEDQSRIGRLPAGRLRGSIGYETIYGPMNFGLAAGGDAVFDNTGGRTYLVPYGEARLEAALGSFTLRLGAGLAANLFDTVDGFASLDRQADAGASYAFTSAIELTAAASILQRRGIAGPQFSFDERALSLAFDHALSEHWSYRLLLSRLWHQETGDAYVNSVASVTVIGTI